MSTYHCYRIGYLHEGKLYPLGPYDAFGNMKEALEKSRSFASELYEDFNYVPKEMVSDELRAVYEYKDYKGEKTMPDSLSYMKISELPKGSFIKKGYFLIEEVKLYESDDEALYFDGFSEMISPTVYTAMAQNEKMFGKPTPEKNEFDEEIPVYSASDYMYYAYPDYKSKEYEAMILRTFAESLDSYSKLPKGYELVAIYERC